MTSRHAPWLEFTVAGVPVPQGSKRAFTTKTGKVVLTEEPQLYSWRQDVAARAQAARGNRLPLAGEVLVMCWFFFPRPATHFGRRGVLPSAPRRPVGKRNDIDKLLRAILDALTAAGIYGDDGQVTDVQSSKWYAEAWRANAPGCRVYVTPVEWRVPGGGDS